MGERLFPRFRKSYSWKARGVIIEAIYSKWVINRILCSLAMGNLPPSVRGDGPSPNLPPSWGEITPKPHMGPAGIPHQGQGLVALESSSCVSIMMMS